MKTIGIVAGILIIVGGIFLAYHRSGDMSEGIANVEAGEVKQVVLPVEGMTCSGCAISVTMALKRLEGIRDTKVDVGKGEVRVKYMEDKVTVDEMVAAINKTGFTAHKPSAG